MPERNTHSRPSPEARAQEILMEHGVLRTTHPVPIIDICKALGVAEVIPHDFDGQHISGAIAGQSGSYAIFVNKSEPATRQRFTIAHELGHFLLHMQRNDDLANRTIVDSGDVEMWFRTDGESSQDERDANRFAAAILMPRDTVLELRDACPVGALAYLLGVSEPAMAVRIRELSRGLH